MKDSRIVKDAVFVIDNKTMFSQYGAPSGFDFDDRGLGYPDGKVFTWNRSEIFSNGKHDYGVYLKRYITPIRCGKAGFSHNFEIVSGDGYFVEFFDVDNNSVLKIMHKDGYFWCGDVKTGVKAECREYCLGVEFDLDNNKAELYFDGDFAGEFCMTSNTLGRVVLGFDKEYTCHVRLKNIFMWTNFLVLDYCYALTDGEWGWESKITGDAKVYRAYYSEGKNMATYCVTAQKGASGSAIRHFDKRDTKVCFNIKYLTKNIDEDVKISLLCGDKRVVTVCDDGQNARTMDGKLLRNHHAYVWVMLRVEADVKEGKAFVKVNGKKCGYVDFNNSADFIDGFEVFYGTPNGGTLKFAEISAFEMLPEPEDYVPAPKAPKKKDYYVGMNICSLWRNGELWGWDVISPFPENKTYLGYYDEGLAEVADWEIKWMKEHGLDFELYCWYNNQLDAPICRTPYSDALFGGHFNAKYGDEMKFALLWEAANCTHPTRETFRKHMVPYFVDYFFTDPRYMIIENKLVVAIFGIDRLIADFGSVEATKEELDYLREVARDLGFDDIIYMACTSEVNPRQVATGVDSIYAYGWGKAGFSEDYTKQMITGIRNAGVVHHVPTVSVGFNNVAWADTRSPMMSTDAMGEVLRWFKEDVLPTNKGEDWRRKFVMFSTWNEYGEGTYICPSGLNGFGYLDEMRKAFTDEPLEHEDVRPNEKQLDRLGYIYPKGRSKLAVQGWEQVSFPDNFVDRIYINTPEALSKMTFNHGIDVKLKDGKLYGVCNEFDPQMILECDIDASKIKAICMDMIAGSASKPLPKKNGSFVETRLYYVTDTEPEWTAQKSILAVVLKDGTLMFDVSRTALWQGKVTALRVDSHNAQGVFSVSCIDLLDNTNNYNVTINGQKYRPHFNPEIVENEVYMTFEPQRNIHSLLKLYYEWDLETKTLMLEYGNKKVYFTQGSDKAVADGVEIQLKKPLEFFDGVPVMPMSTLCKLAGYTLNVDGKDIIIELK